MKMKTQYFKICGDIAKSPQILIAWMLLLEKKKGFKSISFYHKRLEKEKSILNKKIVNKNHSRNN